MVISLMINDDFICRETMMISSCHAVCTTVRTWHVTSCRKTKVGDLLLFLLTCLVFLFTCPFVLVSVCVLL